MKTFRKTTAKTPSVQVSPMFPESPSPNRPYPIQPPTTPPVSQQAQNGLTPTSLLQDESEDENMVLFRTGKFFVQTANSPQQQRHNPLRKRSGNTSLLGEEIIEQVRWLSVAKQRSVDAETRLLPNVEAINPVQKKEIPFPLWLEGIVVVLALAIGLIAHVVNMFNYPLYEQAEGTYMANAWAVLHGMLQPYPYIYTQPPLGWIQIASWIQFTGGFFSFGNALNSGRVLMVVYALASTFLVYRIANRLGSSRSAGLLAMLLFSLSPLSIIYQREVLLENIGVFWLLLSLYFLVCGDSRLRSVVYAAIAFSIAILTKEVFLVFLPALLYAVSLHTTTFQRKFALIAFTYITLSLASFFVLFALLKGELLPTGVLPWDTHVHPSLVATLMKQWNTTTTGSTFAMAWHVWTTLDRIFVFAGAIATAINLIGGFKNRFQWVVALLALSFCLYLFYTNAVFPFSILPLLPLMALNIALAVQAPLRWITKRVGFDLLRALLIFSVIGILITRDIQITAPAFSQQPNTVQTQAMLWLRNNVPHNSVLIVDSTLYTDLHETGGASTADGTIYPYAHIYWNVTSDPELYGTLLHNNADAIDYLVVTPTMLRDIKNPDTSMLLLNRALHHAILRTEFRSTYDGQVAIIQIYQVIHAA